MAHAKAARVPALDGVRGLAILGVLALHLGQTVPVLDGGLARLTWIASFGNVGVDLFFVLSGFLITGALLDAKGRASYFRRFYWRRALRIMPLYYGILAATSFATGGLGGHAMWFWLHLANWVRYFHPEVELPSSLAVTWSLGIEEQFYAVWPLVVLALSPRALLRGCGCILIAEPVLRALAVVSGMPLVGIWAATPFRLDGLAAGAALAVLLRNPGGLTAIGRWAKFIALAAVSGGVASTIPSEAYTLAPLVIIVGYSCMAIASAALLVLALTSARAARLVSVSPLRLYGRLSYGIYLFHLPLLYSLVKFGWIGVALWLPACLGSAWLSWRYLESPFLSLKNWSPAGRPRAQRATGDA